MLRLNRIVSLKFMGKDELNGYCYMLLGTTYSTPKDVLPGTVQLLLLLAQPALFIRLNNPVLPSV
jgi:hypothetical protein